MKTNLKWRLGKLPTSEEVRELVKDKLITHDEAREILFNNETIEEKSVADLKSEVKFLKEIIEKLSDRNKIVEVIRTVEHHYPQPWIQQYTTWCGSNVAQTMTSISGASSINLTAGATGPVIDCAFSQIG